MFFRLALFLKAKRTLSTISFNIISLMTNLSSPYSILDRSINEVTISLNLFALCKMAFEKVFASFLSSSAPSKRVSELAFITLTGVLSSCDKFETKSLRIESICLN